MICATPITLRHPLINLRLLASIVYSVIFLFLCMKTRRGLKKNKFGNTVLSPQLFFGAAKDYVICVAHIMDRKKKI